METLKKSDEEIRDRWLEVATELEAIKGKPDLDSIALKAKLVGQMDAYAWVLGVKVP